MIDGFQITGAKFLAARRAAILADEMRVGKTRQAIAALNMVEHSMPAVVIAPTVGLYNWENEIHDNCLLGSSVHVIDKRHKLDTVADIAVCPYSLVTDTNVREYLMDLNPAVVIPDECHYLKNADAQRTESIFGSKTKGVTGLVQRCKHFWALSGTPAPNHSAELWPLLRVMGVYKGSYLDFVAEFCITRPGYGDRKTIVTGIKNPDKLKALLAPVLLRRLRKDVLNEQPITIDSFVVEGDGSYIERHWLDDFKAQKRLIENNQDSISDYLEDNLESFATLRKCIGLLKVNPAVDLANDILQTKNQVVIFTYHREVAERIAEKLGASLILGGMSAKKKQNVVTDFKNGLSRVLVGTMQSCGEVVDFSTADTIIAVELDWVPKNNQQAFARCSGHNQSNPVQILCMSVSSIVDIIITKTLIRKIKDLKEIF